MSGVGPIIAYDKSALQGLSVDEAVWFDTFYYPNTVPIFWVETLADLDKEVAKGRTPEDVVGNIADKTPTGGQPNVFHEKLVIAELLGSTKVGMERVAVVEGGKAVLVGGRRGL